MPNPDEAPAGETNRHNAEPIVQPCVTPDNHNELTQYLRDWFKHALENDPDGELATAFETHGLNPHKIEARLASCGVEGHQPNVLNVVGIMRKTMGKWWGMRVKSRMLLAPCIEPDTPFNEIAHNVESEIRCLPNNAIEFLQKHTNLPKWIRVLPSVHLNYGVQPPEIASIASDEHYQIEPHSQQLDNYHATPFSDAIKKIATLNNYLARLLADPATRGVLIRNDPYLKWILEIYHVKIDPPRLLRSLLFKTTEKPSNVEIDACLPQAGEVHYREQEKSTQLHLLGFTDDFAEDEIGHLENEIEALAAEHEHVHAAVQKADRAQDAYVSFFTSDS